MNDAPTPPVGPMRVSCATSRCTSSSLLFEAATISVFERMSGSIDTLSGLYSGVWADPRVEVFDHPFDQSEVRRAGLDDHAVGVVLGHDDRGRIIGPLPPLLRAGRVAEDLAQRRGHLGRLRMGQRNDLGLTAVGLLGLPVEPIDDLADPWHR